MRAAALCLILTVACPLIRSQGRPEERQLDASESLFAVLAAINAGGYDTDIDSLSNNPLRKALRDHLAQQKLESIFELQRFVRDHHQKDPVADLGQYISFALITDGPPAFDKVYKSNILPADVTALEGLTPLLVAFCREAKIDELWQKVQPAYDKVIAQYHDPISRAVLSVNSYLRNPTSGYLGRRFQIYVDLLGAPNQVQTRSYVDDYYVVVTPTTEPRIDDIRHAYLHYLIDPLGIKFSKYLLEKKALGDYALGSPLLEDYYKQDFVLLATECFIKAVESRLDRKPAAAEQALREGFVLTPAFAELLADYEKQEVAMRLWFPDLVEGLDFRKEEKRLDHVEFASKRTERTVRVSGEKPIVLTGAEKTLDQAEQAYSDRNLKLAKDIYLQVLRETDRKPLHARAYYGLARISVLEKHPEEADRLFEKVQEFEPDPATKSWSLLYRGRLADAQDRRDDAAEFYKQALAVPNAPESVKQAAQKGLKEAFKK